MPDAPAPITTDDLDADRPVPAGFQVLDVREDDEWAAGHVPGAVHIPMGELPARVEELPEEELIVVCRSGGRSARASAWLNSTGFDAYNLEGGLAAWQRAGLPLTAEGGHEPTVL